MYILIYLHIYFIKTAMKKIMRLLYYDRLHLPFGVPNRDTSLLQNMSRTYCISWLFAELYRKNKHLNCNNNKAKKLKKIHFFR